MVNVSIICASRSTSRSVFVKRDVARAQCTKEMDLNIKRERSVEQNPGVPNANMRADVDLDEADSYVYQDQEVNMCHNLQPETARRKDAG